MGEGKRTKNGDYVKNKGYKNVDNCILNVPHEIYNVIWRYYMHG